MESHNFAYATHKNHAQLYKIYQIIAFKLHKIRINYVILNRTKILISSKLNLGKDPSAETLDGRLRTLVNVKCKKYLDVWQKTEMTHVDNTHIVCSVSVTRPLHCFIQQESRLSYQHEVSLRNSCFCSTNNWYPNNVLSD